MSPHKKFYEQYENIGGLTDEQLVEAIKEIEMRAIGGDEATGGSSLREMNDARYQALSDEQYRRDKAMNKALDIYREKRGSKKEGSPIPGKRSRISTHLGPGRVYKVEGDYVYYYLDGDEGIDLPKTKKVIAIEDLEDIGRKDMRWRQISRAEDLDPEGDPHDVPWGVVVRPKETSGEVKPEPREPKSTETQSVKPEGPVGIQSIVYKKSMNKAWNEFKKIGVSESDGMGTGISVNGGFGLNEEMERNDNKNMPQNIQNEKGMKRKVVGNEGYTDIDTPHTDSFYLPGKVKDEEADASDKTEGKEELSSDNKVRKKQPFNTGMTAQATIG